MSTTAAKPRQLSPLPQPEPKVFFRPRFGIRAQQGGLSVDVSTGPEKDEEKDGPPRG